MEKLVTKWFLKWAVKAGLSNCDLLDSLVHIENGLSVVDLGGNLFKIRMKRKGQGKSSGYRTIVVYRKGVRVVFLYGFAKNERGNINSRELSLFQKLGSDLLKLDSSQLKKALKNGVLFDLEDDR